jgi:hypothetical protein
VIKEYPGRTVLGFSLMASQAVLYNATLFGMVSIMTTFFHASKANAPLYIIPFAIGNLLGPWLLGPLFDSVGRKVMISATYIISGVVLLVTAYLFYQQVLSVTFAFVIGGVIMAIGGVIEILLGVEDERKPLEAIARPINAVRGAFCTRHVAALRARRRLRRMARQAVSDTACGGARHQIHKHHLPARRGAESGAKAPDASSWLHSWRCGCTSREPRASWAGTWSRRCGRGAPRCAPRGWTCSTRRHSSA